MAIKSLASLLALFLMASPMDAIPIAANVTRAGIMTSCVDQNLVAMTFDDGPSPQNTLTLLNTLAEQNVKATFFLNGNNMANIMDPNSADAEIVRKTIAAGHTIASHTYGHADLATLQNEDDIRKQVCWNDQAISAIIGKSPRFFRFPYGSVSDKAFRIVQELGYTVVHWNVDTNDWRSGSTVADMVRSYTDPMKSGSTSVISLQHDIHARTVNELVPAAIKAIKELPGWSFVSVNECLKEEPYRESPSWQSSDAAGAWYCPVSA